jgi:hypothetical protein
MIGIIKRALEYATTKTQNPIRIKEYMEEYLDLAGYDRRYKFKWRSLSGNATHTFSGIFEFANQKYYFSKTLGKLELKRI